MPLSERDKAILDFERRWWSLPGPKEASIRCHLAMSATRYYRLLGSLVDSSEALAYDPLVVRRLRRVRDHRRRTRFEGPSAGMPPVR